MSNLRYTIQYSDYFNRSWRNETLANESTASVGGYGSSSALNETYEIYAPNYPYVSSTEEQNYIEQLSERLKNGSNHTLYGINHPIYPVGECSTNYWAGLYFEITSYFLYVLIFVTAVIGNSIVLFIVQSNPRMRTVTNYFITNLAVGDLLMMLFCVPFTFISSFVLQYWPFGLAMCRLVNYTQAVSVLVSAYTLVAISGDRYIAIMWPLKPRITKTCSKVLIGVVWIIALITAAPIAIFSTLILPSEWHTVCNLPICKEMWPSKEQESYYTTTLLMTQFVIPLLVLIYTYTRIAIVVWGKRPPGEAENSRDQRMAKSKRKMIKMMVTVVIVFTICWLPFNFLMVIDVDTSWELLPYLWFAFHWLAMSHSCYNPIIYCYMNARFRSGFILVLHGVPGLQQLCCCIRHKPSALARNAGSSVALAGIDEISHLHRVNTCTTYISTRRKTALNVQQVQSTETSLLR
ncbi:RYamide receptor-like isoform X1 [Topomyia yanbarensis]|uniref:RYamide receptor-like isoform X1 n=1 Tax=Topomyia yanbarensis TaxID=2498891 RepID=UPI00273CEAFC|nr:RYamide receptor-like isoform X1 [Topomyia yanbarensis]XP_058822036.1 RYamide receptor-like isoform X1 [Topomyia yanbarensis]